MNTPCPGLTMYRTREGHAFIDLAYQADPEFTPEKQASLRATMTEAFWQREMERKADALDGTLVYPEWDEAVHVIPDREIPRRGSIFCSIDPHPRTPHAILWILVDRWSDWYAFREMWPSRFYGEYRRIRDDEQDYQWVTWEYADNIAALEGNQIEWVHGQTDREYGRYQQQLNGEKIALRFMDQAGKAFVVTGEGQPPENYNERYTKYDLPCIDPKKSHLAGEDAIHSLLKLRWHDLRGMWPRLHVAESCRELRLEFANHRYLRTRTPTLEKDLKQDASKFRTHMLDNLRYIATSPSVCWSAYTECQRHDPHQRIN